MAELEEFKNSYDWQEAFAVAGFDVSDVIRIIASYEGCNEEENWLAVAETKDGKFVVVDAGCDYTGWDCRCWGTGEVYKTEGESLSSLTPTQAKILGIDHEANKK